MTLAPVVCAARLVLPAVNGFGVAVLLLVFPVRTNKFITRHMPGFIRAAVVELLLGIALLATGVVLAVADYRRSMFAALRMSGMLFAVVWVWHQTRHTFRLTRALEDKDRNGRHPTGTPDPDCFGRGDCSIGSKVPPPRSPPGGRPG